MQNETRDLDGSLRMLGDPARLAALRATKLLDTPAEASFDRLTRLAARLLGVSVTFISLLDETRDFYKSCFGLPEPLATDREMSGATFCQFTLSSAKPLVINDTLADPVFREVPTVRSLGVRAYLGIPLVTRGQSIGSFCAVDTVPRVWSELDVEIMAELALSTLREIELRLAVREITADQERLHALAESNERLYTEAKSANEQKDRFFAAVTHELRTPMASIIGWSRVLRELTYESADATEAVSMIENSARDQARLVDDLLEASRVAIGKISLHPTLIHLNHLLDELVRSNHPAAEESGVDLRLSAQPVPALIADGNRIRQIMGNLISNALKFTPRGGSIEVLARADETHVTMEVRDTGRGIAAETLPHIFQRGWQSQSAEQGGLGLGLTIAGYLAELHGGGITASSKGPGLGATFIVSLPLQPVVMEQTEVAGSPERRSDTVAPPPTP